MWSYADMLIQLARCKFYTVGPLHTAMSATLYWYAPVRSKRPVGEMYVAFTQRYRNKPSETGPKFGWYGKVNQKSSRFANVPFHSYMNKKGKFSSGSLSGPAGFLRLHAMAFQLLSPSILEKLSFPSEVPVLSFLFLDTSF